MFTKRITIVRLLGIDVKIDASWIFLAALVSWSLATGLFPRAFPNQSELTCWLMGFAGALGLFASIIAHEFGHALVARRYGIPIEDITLFIFGGVANMKREPDRARDEFLMAIAGPLVSVGLGLGGYFALRALKSESVIAIVVGGTITQTITPLTAVIAYLSVINVVLAVFNMIPAFPLDGGRVFRAFLWGVTGDLRRATRAAAFVGSGFGVFMMILGVLSFLNGNVISGLWRFLIGLFVRNASRSSYRHILLKTSLGGRPVADFMTRQLISVPPHISLREFAEDYVYRHHHKLYPVADNGRIYGVVSTRELQNIPSEKWDRHRVADITTQLSSEIAVPASTGAAKVLDQMNATGHTQMFVIEGQVLVGIVALNDLLELLTPNTQPEPQT